jgi:hypothetical protein
LCSEEILTELRALTGRGSLKAFEEQSIEFVHSHWAAIEELARQLAERDLQPAAVEQLLAYKSPTLRK